MKKNYTSAGDSFRFLLILAALFYLNPLQAQLSGKYTINPSNSASALNYINIGSAVSDMVKGSRSDGGPANGTGIKGPVVFLISDGVYKEQLLIDSVAGASATNRITFQSASGDSSKVIITWPSSTSKTNNYVLYLNGADFFSFRQLTFLRSQPTSSAIYGNTIVWDGGANYNHFLNNVVISAKYQTTGGTSDVNPFSSLKDADNGTWIMNNRIRYGWTGVCISHSASTAYEVGTHIDGNVIDSSAMFGLYLYGQDSISIRGNKIRDIINNNATGIFATHWVGASGLHKNIIDMPYGTTSYGIELYYVNGNGTDSCVLTNNVISMRSKGIAYGIYSFYGGYQSFIHNTVNLEGSYSASYSVYVFSTPYPAISFYNNNFVNKSKGYVFQAAANVISYSDHNNLYTNGPYLGSYANQNKSTLVDWQAATGMEAASICADPKFYSPSDLHVKSVFLYQMGQAASGFVVDDIDGDVRNASTPDIGADEFVPTGLDAGITSLDSPGINFCTPGTQSVYATLTNFGGTTLTNADINWKFNGISQTTVAWTGSLAAGKSASVLLGKNNFASNNTYDIKVWTSNPNGGKDLDSLNDTLLVTGISQGLSGTYTIDGSSSTAGTNFKTFSDAVAGLNANGLCGPVVFNVSDGIYQDQISLKKIRGSSKLNSVIFRSKSGDSSKVILTWPSVAVIDYVVDLNGANWVTFKQMTFKRTGTGQYGGIIRIGGSASNNTISNNRILSVKATSSSTTGACIYSFTDIDTNNLFENNLIRNGLYGIYLSGILNSIPEPGNKIINNIIDSAYGGGIFLTNTSSPIVKGNTVSNVLNTFAHGISFWQANYDKIRCIGNKIFLPNGGHGIFCPSGGVMTSIGTSDTALIANNFVTVGGVSAAYGIFAYTNLALPTYINIYHNSVLVTSSNAIGYPLYVNGNKASFRVFNNIFVNKGGSYCVYIAKIASINEMDYNDLYAIGKNIAFYSSDVASFSAWQAYSGYDAHGKNIDPKFVSNRDLHTSSAALNGMGIPMLTITDDIDGQSRNTTAPDPGADEYPAPTDDMEMNAILSPVSNSCGDSNTAVIVRIRNLGSNSQKGIPVYVSINGGTPYSTTHAGSLNYGQWDTVILTTRLNTYSGGTHKIKAWTGLSSDVYHPNDTMTASLIIHPVPRPPLGANVILCGPGTATITAKSPPGMLTLWYDSLNSNTPIATGDIISKTLTASKTYYASTQSFYNYQVAPKTKSVLGTNSNFTTADGLIFDAGADFRLDSLVIYPNSSGPVITELFDGSGSRIGWDSQYVSVTTKGAAVKIGLTNLLVSVTQAGFDVAAGSGYSLIYDKTGTGAPLLMGNNPATAIPYPLKYNNRLVSITGTTNAANPNSYYYYYYDWKVSLKSCESARTPVTVTVGASGAVTSLDKGMPFQGKYTAGSLTAPDQVCAGDTVAYQLPAPKGFNNAGYGNAWDFRSISIGDLKGLLFVNDTATFIPTAGQDFRLRFTPKPTSPDSLYLIKAEVRLLPSGCTNTINRYIKVNSLPDASFLATNILGLTARFSPKDSANTGNSYSWNFGDTTYSPLMQPIHSYKANGSYLVQLKTATPAGCSASDTLTLKIYNTSLRTQTGPLVNVDVYPNPFSKSITISYVLDKAETVSFAVFDLDGRAVFYQKENLQSAGIHSLTFEAEKQPMPAGIYLLKMKVGEGERMMKLVKVE